MRIKETMKRALRGLLALCLVVTLLPGFTPAAAAADTGKAVQLGTGGISDPSGSTWDYVYVGAYQQSSDGNGGYKIEPIKWRVLENAGGKLFLLSDQNLDVFRYHMETESVTWETSIMRSWLNGLAANQGSVNNAIDYADDNFLDHAFSAKEQTAIADTEAVDDDNPDYGTGGGNNTTDKIFLLSIAEANNSNYFADDNSRIATNTAYVAGGGKTNGGMFGAGKADYWWLRSLGQYENKAAFVNNKGSVSSSGDEVHVMYIAVRPAFNLDTSKILFTSAADGSVQKEFGAVADYDGSEWKVTLADGNSFAEGASVNMTAPVPGDTLTVTHPALISFADAGYTNVTAMLTSGSGEVLYYGSINTDDAATTSTLTIPVDLAVGTYTLSVYGEQWNGEKETDHATGTPFSVQLTVHEHEWENTYEFDDEVHWNPCKVSDCTVRSSSTAHSAKSAIGKTCQGSFCTVCENWYGDQDPDKHIGYNAETGKCSHCQETIVASVTVGENVAYYTNLLNAFQAVADCVEADNAVVKLLADTDLNTEHSTDTAIRSGTFTIDLNGKTLTNSNSQTVLWFYGQDSDSAPIVTITDTSEAKTGTIDAGAQVGVSAAVAVEVQYGSEVALRGGTYKGSHPIGVYGTDSKLVFDGAVVEAVFTGIDLNDGATAEVRGGKISAARPFDVDGSLTITVAPEVEVTGSGAEIVYYGGSVDLSGCTNIDGWGIDNWDEQSLALREGLKLPDGYELYLKGDIFTPLSQLASDQYGEISDHRHADAPADGDHLCDGTGCQHTMTGHEFDASGSCTDCGQAAPWQLTYMDGSTGFDMDLQDVLKRDIALEQDEIDGNDVVSVRLRQDLKSDDWYIPECDLELDLDGHTLDLSNGGMHVSTTSGLTISGGGSIILGEPIMVSGTLTVTGGTKMTSVSDTNICIELSWIQARVDLSKSTACEGLFIRNRVYDVDSDVYELVPISADFIQVPEGDGLAYTDGSAVGEEIQAGAIVVVSAHAHAWSYTAEGGTITATCTNAVGTCDSKTVTIKLNDPGALTYDGTEKTVTVTQSPAGILENVPAQVSGGWVKAGQHTAALTYGGVTAELKFNIAKATPVIGDVTCDAALVDTQKPAEVQLARVDASLPGTLALTDAKLSADAETYNWKFTPKDTENYNTITGTVKLKVSHVDGNLDHSCDGCGKQGMGTHADSAADKDHVCDYGCKAVLEGCSGGKATCMAPAVCAVCGQAYGEKDPTSHTGKNTVSGKVDATCGAAGYTGDTVCECGVTIAKGEAIPATGGHTWGEWKTTLEPTTTAEGAKERGCTICGATETEKIPMLDQEPGEDSCTGGHTWGEWVTVLEPTTTAEGIKECSCTICGTTKSEKIPMLDKEPEDSSCTGGPACPMAAFPDLDPEGWYHEGVHYCIENGLMNGNGDGRFDPAGTMTRAMVVTILWRMEGKPAAGHTATFDDVAEGEWYTDAIAWAQKNGIVTGYTDQIFGTHDRITREQLAAVLYRYEQHKGSDVTAQAEMDFVDVGSVSQWAYDAMSWAVGNGIITGRPGKILDPNGNAIRAEAATMLHRYCIR